MWVQICHTMTSYPRNKESLQSLMWKAQTSLRIRVNVVLLYDTELVAFSYVRTQQM